MHLELAETDQSKRFAYRYTAQSVIRSFLGQQFAQLELLNLGR
jgi:hypothetical protein